MDGIYLRLSVTSRCNLRCVYCRPETDCAALEAPLTAAELDRLFMACAAAGPVRKLRFTGGEPLLRADIVELVRAARRELPRAELCLTTNGLNLARHARDLKDAGLDRVNVSLDAADETAFAAMTRGGGFADVIAGLEALHETGLRPIKINSVLMRGYNGGSLEALVDTAMRFDAVIRFIELMPLGEGRALWENERLPADEALELLKSSMEYLGPLERRGTAALHRFRKDGRTVEAGFITPVSHPFCGTCDRLRVDSTGRLFACLRRAEGTDLAPFLRSGDVEAVRDLLSRAWSGKGTPDGDWPALKMSALGG